MRAPVQRFFRGLWARLSPAEEAFLQHYLSPAERALFGQMATWDRRHCLDVGMELARRAEGRPAQEVRFLARAGLLHDIGKVRGDQRLWHRPLLWFLWRFRPRRALELVREGARLARRGQGRGTLARAAYVQWVHPRRGAYMARLFGVEEPVLQVIRRHHRRRRPGEPEALTWLRETDDLR